MARKLSRKRWRRPQRLTLEGPPVVRRKDLVMPTLLDLDPVDARRTNARRIGTVVAVFLTASLLESGVAAVLFGWPATFLGLAGVGYLMAGVRWGDRWVQHVLRATEVSAPELRNGLQGVVSAAAAPPPQLVMVPGDAPNALSLGFRRRWVAITSGVAGVGRLEREALFAHELAHLRDGDAAVASAQVLLGGAFELVGRGLRAPRGWLTLLSLPVWPACLLVRLLSPTLVPADRELRADVAGALLTRYPPAMRDLLRSATGEHSPSALAPSDRFWFVPRTTTRGPDAAERARLVGEM